MKPSSTLVLAALLSAFVFSACKKPPEPTQPTTPEPQAQADNSAGTTTNFENPAPAEPPKQ